ncbi:MAG: redoxin domain-containing protein [Nitrospinota bacterium]
MENKLTGGVVAPDFTAQTWRGDGFSLHSLKGKKVWLAFFRYAACPLCNLRVREIIVNYGDITKNGLEIISVFQSPPESIAKYVGKQKPPFTMLSDPEENLYELYRLETSVAGFLNPANIVTGVKAMTSGFMPGKIEGSVTRIPGDFLIDAEMKIQTAFYGNAIKDHIPIDMVMAFAGS